MENLKNVAPIEDFNWDAYENGESVASASHSFLGHTAGGTGAASACGRISGSGNDRGQAGSAPENERQGGQAGS